MQNYVSLSLLLVSCTLLPGCGCSGEKETQSTIATDVAEVGMVKETSKEAPTPAGAAVLEETEVVELAMPGKTGEVIEFSATRGNAKSQLDNMVKAGTAVVDFYAPWCGPCKGLAPKLHNLAKERTDVTFIKVNVDNFPDFGIRSMPTIIIYKDGKEFKRIVGADFAAIKAAI